MPPPSHHANPNAVAAAQGLLVQARKLMEGLATHYLALGDVLNALQDRDLYLSIAPYDSFRHFLQKEGLVAYATARRYMLLARTYPSPDSRKMGVEKALALLRLATEEGLNPDDLAAGDAEIDGRPISEHDADSLDLLRRANEKRREKLEAERQALLNDPKLVEQHQQARSTARKLERAMESSFALPDASVRAVRGKHNALLRVQIDLSEPDALELLEIIRAQKDDA